MLRLASFLADSARPIYERIADYLAVRLEAPVELLQDVPWEERHRRLDAGEIDVAFICGLPYTQKHDRPDRPIELLCAPVMAAPRYGARPVYFTDVVVRHDDPAHAFTDLRGRAWTYSHEGSHSGYNVMRHHLLVLGETKGYFGRVVASGSHQNSIRMILDGTADASGIDSTVLELELARRPELAGLLRTVAAVGPSPIPPTVVARGLAPSLKARLQEIFLGMPTDPPGRAVLAYGRMTSFVPVRDADYDPIRAMVRRAEAAGPLTWSVSDPPCRPRAPAQEPVMLRIDPEQREVRALERVAEWRDRHVLEVGCGEGRLSLRLARLGAVVCGIDPDGARIRAARRRLRRFARRVRFRVGRAERLTYPAESFDLVVLSWAL
jgi:ABC-type phosphate/phosphonate transport system substrate-binding protein